MDALITAGTAIQRTTEVIQSGVSVGVAGHRITTTVLAVELEAARLDQHPVAVAPSAVPRAGHPLAAAPAPAVAASAHHPREHRLVEAHAQVVEASAHHPRAHHLVEARERVEEVLARHLREHRLVEDHPLHQVAASVPQGPGVPVPSDQAHRQVALAQHVLRLAEAHRALEAHAQVAAASSVGEAAVPAPVVVASLEVATVPAEAASLVAVAADAAPVDLVALEAADDDRFGLCNRRRLGFDHAA